MKDIKLNNKNKISFVIGSIFVLLLIIGSAFAYYQVVSTNNATLTTINTTGEELDQVSFVTNISSLTLKLTAEMMQEDYIGKKYYATETGEEEVETPTLGNGKYTLATASVIESSAILDCNYSYDISATVSKTISDASSNDFKVAITESSGFKTVYTLKQLLDGVVHEGQISKLSLGENKTIQIEAYIENTNNDQNALQGIEYSLSIKLVEGEEGFSCRNYEPYNLALNSKGQPVASFMVANQSKIDGLWSSGLEGDGLRYVGSGAYNGDTTPSNFICFGTTSASECKANEDKYMYRIIGVFPDEQGNQHLKLRKFKQLGEYAWHSTDEEDKNWGESTLYTELNGSYFLENTTYDYLQNVTWSDKIVDWKWVAVNTKTYSDNGPNYYSIEPRYIYLHEMNRSTKTSTVGEWTYPTGKIGLIYASDYVLSLGDEALTMTGSTYDNRSALKTGWLHYTNNLASSSSAYDWTIARYGDNGGSFTAWYVYSSGIVGNYFVMDSLGVAPVFYLTSETTISGGMGTYSEPYIIG